MKWNQKDVKNNVEKQFIFIKSDLKQLYDI